MNNNTFTSTALFKTLTIEGIRLENSDNSTITQCSINTNAMTMTGLARSVVFTGIEITASVSNTGHNSIINTCEVNGNTIEVDGQNTLGISLVGIQVGSTSSGQDIPSDSCQNCSVVQNTINNNTLLHDASVATYDWY